MQTDPTHFEPSPDDLEFEGRFAHFASARVVITFLLTVLGVVGVARLLPAAQPDRESLAGVLDLIDQAIASHADESVILLGDSVLRGQVMEAHGIVDWQHWTVGAQMQRLIHRDVSVAITDLSMDGLLPGDLLALVILLEQRDPEARVQLAVELTPRYLSQSYAQLGAAFSREFLRDVVLDSAEPDFVERMQLYADQLALTEHRLGMDGLRESLPEGLQNPGSILQRESPPEAELTPEESKLRRELHRGRVAPHFLGVDASPLNVQTEFLAQAAAAIATGGRQALFFVTPIDESYLLKGADPKLLLEATSAFRPLVDAGEAGSPRRFLNFNDYSFGSDAFLDHCHLTPAGNGHLAQRLLRSLSIPLDQAPPLENMVHGLGEIRAHVLGGMQTGRQDGVGEQVQFGVEKQLVEVRPGFLFVSDTSNGRICEVHIASRTSRTLFAADVETGATPFDAPGFRPGPLLADGLGGAYFLDTGSGHVGQIDSSGEVRCITDRRPWRIPGMRVKLAQLAEELLIYEGSRGAFYTLNPESGVVTALDQLPPMPGLRSIVQGPGGRVFVLDVAGTLIVMEPATSGSPAASALVLATADETQATVFWQDLLGNLGLLPGNPTRLSLSDPSQLFFSKDRLYISDRFGEFYFCWRVDLETYMAYPLLMPGSDGLFVVGPTSRIVQSGSWTASSRGMVYWLGDRSSLLFQFRDELVGRLAWDYWSRTPPFSPSAVSTHGLSHGARRPGEFRVGVFGSSLIGSNFVESIPAPLKIELPAGSFEVPVPDLPTYPLVTTRSFPLLFGEALRSQLAGQPRQVDVVDFTQRQASIVDQYVALVAQDPAELDVAILCLDRGSTAMDTSMSVIGPVEQWRRMEREDTGLPKIGWVDSLRPAPVWSDERSNSEPVEALIPTILSCLTEMLDYCEARGILPVLVDITGIDNRSSFGFGVRKPESLQLPNAIEMLLRDRGVAYISPTSRFLAQSGTMHPMSAAADHHLLGRAHEALAELVASRLRGAIELELFQFDERLAKRRELIANGLPRQRVAALLGGQALDGARASAYGIDPGHVQVLRIGSQVTILVEFEPAGGLAPWRAALVAYGAAGAVHAREGDIVTMRLVRYANHNEYGAGVADSVEDLGRFGIEEGALKVASSKLIEVLGADTAPNWLHNQELVE